MKTPTHFYTQSALKSARALALALPLALIAVGTAQAQTAAAPAAAEATKFEATYNLGLVTDYRYRGISQTRLKPAVQGGFDGTYGDFYVGAWASNINWLKDAGLKGRMELDLYGGYKYAVTKDVTIDVGLLSYIYPSNNSMPNANTTEVYLGAASGPFSAKYSHAITNAFGFTDSKGSNYLEANVDYELRKGLNLVAHIGYQKIKNTSAASYTDYKLGATYEALGGKFAASLVGTDSKNFYLTPAGKNNGKTGLVLGYTRTF